jgi:hypothetical protein
VERTRTGPYAARSDLEHQVNHHAKIFNFYHVSAHTNEEGGPTSAGKTRCLAVTFLTKFTNSFIMLYPWSRRVQERQWFWSNRFLAVWGLAYT